VNSSDLHPHKSHLLADGSTFPPVTPDPPPPPGYVDPLEAAGKATEDPPDGDDESSSLG